MTKQAIIKAILDASQIHHNISTLRMNLPDAPEDAPNDIFWDTCQILVEDFIENWRYEPRNDSGNRNLCGCGWSKHEKYKPQNILKNGACKEHDLYHVYTYGRTGATLYWDKYWEGSNSGFSFKWDKDELEAENYQELAKIYNDIVAFNKAVKGLMTLLPMELEYRYKEWQTTDKEEKRREALGYNKTLGELLEEKNPGIVRLAKGIKKELNK